MLHIMLHDKVKNSIIRSKTKVKDILERMKETKWRWAGHVARREDNRRTRHLPEWQPRTGKRRRGRQKRRWRDDITPPTLVQPGLGQCKTEEDGSYLRMATSDSGWCSHKWVCVRVCTSCRTEALQMCHSKMVQRVVSHFSFLYGMFRFLSFYMHKYLQHAKLL